LAKERRMLLRIVVIAFALVGGLGVSTAEHRTFRYAFQGDLNSLDPYTLNETFTLSTLANVMEGLIKRDKDLQIVPGLAESWEVLEPTRWRVHLRQGVEFHDGSPFTADDVVFSADRVRGEGSLLKSRLAESTKVVKVDDHTVDFVLASPNPLLMQEWETWLIMSKNWSEANGATKVQPATRSLGPAALKANGTGPFMLVSHEPGVKTVLRRNPGWWGKPEHNLDEVVVQPIKSDATRLAALQSGEIDMVDPVPLQDVERLPASGRASVLAGPELRTIFLNMDSYRDELLYSNVKGKNPFKDPRVRKAFYQAIDIAAIDAKIMRGMAKPTPLMIAPMLFARSGEFKRHPFDVAAARRLMKEAGYEDGFELTMDCPNDRYVNDELICQAVSAMLSKIGVKITLNIMPKTRYFEKIGPTSKYDSSFHLLGWSANTLDSWNVLANLVVCRDANGKGGTFNFGGYCNPEIDRLTAKILVEGDLAQRDAMIAEAFRLLHEDVGMIPLHQQSLAWGVAKGVTVAQRADGHLRFEWVRKP
jgi:peptide/nickel transport system substrate-binding protein